MAGAGAVVLLTALLLRDAAAPSLSALFAAIAALALPHMLVTPLWRISASARAPVPNSRKSPAPDFRPYHPASTYLTSSGAGQELRVARALEQDARDLQAGVEPDKVRQRQRPHRMIEPQPARRVDVGNRRDALAQREARFVEHRHQHAVDDKARRVVGVHDPLAQPLRIAFHRRHCRIGGGEPADELDQPHHRHGIEKMHPHEPCRIGRRLREPG